MINNNDDDKFKTKKERRKRKKKSIKTHEQSVNWCEPVQTSVRWNVTNNIKAHYKQN